MVPEQLGRFHGLWASREEIVSEMLHIAGEADVPCVLGGVFEGMVLCPKSEPALVFEVLLADPRRERFYLIDVGGEHGEEGRPGERSEGARC